MTHSQYLKAAARLDKYRGTMSAEDIRRWESKLQRYEESRRTDPSRVPVDRYMDLMSRDR